MSVCPHVSTQLPPNIRLWNLILGLYQKKSKFGYNCRQKYRDLYMKTYVCFVVCFLLSAYDDETECSKTSAYKIQMPGNYPEESIQHPKHGKSLKSRVCVFHYCWHQTATKVLSSSEMVSGYQDGPVGIHIRKSSNQTVLQRRHCCIILLSVTYESLQYKGNIIFSC
jgi:hypothetical protein